MTFMPRFLTNRLNNQPAWPFFVLFYIVLANLPFWATKRSFGLFHNGWFCVEYAVVGILALFLPRAVVALLLFLTIVADVIAAICETYFLLPEDCLKNLNALPSLPGSRILTLISVLLLTAAIVAIAAWLPGRQMPEAGRRRAAVCLVAFIAISVTIDFAMVVRREGHIPNPLRSRSRSDAAASSYFGEWRLTRRTTLRLAYLEVNQAEIANADQPFHQANLAISSATQVAAGDAGLFAIPRSRQAPNVALILVESWGLSGDPKMRDALVQPYTDPELLAKYQVINGSVPFYGPTVGGEGRELCGSKIGFHLLTVTATGFQDCIPDRLAALGYHNVAVHGFEGQMFSRAEWYSRMGFQETWFQPQFQKLGLPDCVGAFTGTCDAAIAGWIGQYLSAPRPSPDFVYWVTLNSHLPVLTPSRLQNGAPCSLTRALQQKPALCSWYQLVANVHNSVAKLAMTPSSRPTVFIMVGDHAPPFADPALRTSFDSTVVPYTLLIPRQDSLATSIASR